jgi:hypothetical protein
MEMSVLILFAFLLGPMCANAGRRRDQKNVRPVMVALTNNEKKQVRHAAGLRTLEFCSGCPDPHLEGSQLLGLAAKHGPTDYTISGQLVYAIPNHGKPTTGMSLLNHDQVEGAVVLCDRGLVPLVDKIKVAQANGAVGVVIVDDGEAHSLFLRSARGISLRFIRIILVVLGSCDAFEGEHNCGLAVMSRMYVDVHIWEHTMLLQNMFFDNRGVLVLAALASQIQAQNGGRW